jgi:hypothetical protein
MRQTTVRFGTRLWAALEREAVLEGVSVAQFVRESAVARLTLIEAERAGDHAGLLGRHHLTGGAVADAVEGVSDASAVTSQSRQARERSAQLREHSEQLRARRHRLGSPARPPA